MLPVERLEKLHDYLTKHKYASIAELSDVLQASPATVRRCITALEGKKIVERTRGGVTLLGSGNTYERPYSIKRRKNEAEKKRIAEYAASLMPANASVYLDASSTVREMTSFLRNMKNVTVCTNDVQIAGDLSSAPNLIVIVTGGVMRQGYYSLSGYLTDQAVRDMRLDCAFMGIDAISENGDMMLTNLEELGTKRFIADTTPRTIVLADHEKFEHGAFLKVWSCDQISLVITGRELSDEQYERFTDLGMHIERV